MVKRIVVAIFILFISSFAAALEIDLPPNRIYESGDEVRVPWRANLHRDDALWYLAQNSRVTCQGEIIYRVKPSECRVRVLTGLNYLRLFICRDLLAEECRFSDVLMVVGVIDASDLIDSESLKRDQKKALAEDAEVYETKRSDEVVEPVLSSQENSHAIIHRRSGRLSWREIQSWK